MALSVSTSLSSNTVDLKGSIVVKRAVINGLAWVTLLALLEALLMGMGFLTIHASSGVGPIKLQQHHFVLPLWMLFVVPGLVGVFAFLYELDEDGSGPQEPQSDSPSEEDAEGV